MGDKVLARAFELASMAVEAEKQGNVAKTKELFTASIDAFRAVLSLPGFIQDAATRQLIESEVEGLKKRKAELVANAVEYQKLEAGLKKLSDPLDSDHLAQRFNRLKGTEVKTEVTLEQMQQRARNLHSDQREQQMGASGFSSQTSNELSKDNPFAGEDWRVGVDPELLSIIEKARDEAKLQ